LRKFTPHQARLVVLVLGLLTVATLTPQTLAPVGDDLRVQRITAGLSQKALAELAECSVSTVRLVEGGWRPSDKMLERLRRGLNAAPTTVALDEKLIIVDRGVWETTVEQAVEAPE
jgi:transcriptional regulator with XRE-family HTH domain